jgi:hypothetical protein
MWIVYKQGDNNMNWEDILKSNWPRDITEVTGERNRRTNKRLFSANQILIDAVEDDLKGHKGTKEELGKLIRSMEKKHPVKVTNLRFTKDLGKYKTFDMAELKITAKRRRYDADTMLVVARKFKDTELFKIEYLLFAEKQPTQRN